MKNQTDNSFDQVGYDKYAYKRDLMYIRPVLLMSTVLYAAFGIMDYLFYPEHLTLFLIIRLGVVVPLILMGILYTYHPSYRKTYQLVLTGLMIISGFGIIVMIYTIKDVNYYYSGISLIIAIAFLLLRIRTVFASIGGLTIVAVFISYGIVLTTVPLEEIIANAFFYLAFIFVGIIGSIYIERFRKNQYYRESVIAGEKVILENEVYHQYENIKNYHQATIYSIANLAESRDNLTGEHIQRVGMLSEMLANELPESMYKQTELSKEEFKKSIKLASVLHDIGKVSISDAILNKPAKLTQEEFETIKTHTTIGFEMLQTIENQYKDNPFIRLGKRIAKSHHEWWDGTGYPEGLKNTDIPLEARIVSIIDVYDALMSKRPYKEAYSKEKSLNIIKRSIGSQFDPKIGNTFVNLVKNKTDF